MEWSPSLQGPHETAIWFTQSQLQSVIRNGIVPEWFHGIISRKTAEELLMSKPPGYFLIRVSESRIGYTLSYRAEDRCRHFMIDVQEDGHYIIVGETMHHQCLQDMVDFHRRSPIMPYNEVLTVACGQSSSIKTDYAELLFPQRHPNPNTSSLPNNSLNADTNLKLSQEVIPPALPNRPNNMKLPAVGSQGRLYPRLEEQFPEVISSLQPTPVLTNRNNHPPELPDRSSLPPLKQNQACTRTVSAPQTPTEHPSSPQRNQEAKPSVVSNLKNFKKKFQKKRSPSQELMNAESSIEATENVYQEITEEQGFSSLPLSYTCPEVGLTNGGLPYEYKQPPPFAPGY
ncbi:hematopoietic SH2 domain-containing protein homolog [Cheilinus undulatus]|uniref:hematopoietic SH2 domain-containing protein homolog n=1 Tax=Cheilinus undulatus TaxID=241271 RepID=UPI001BD340EB|nr:hematopoietic SH2 domain-containing protein homolog [Cheilinus undulatus]